MNDQKRYKAQTGTVMELSNDLLESCFPYVELTKEVFEDILNHGIALGISYRVNGSQTVNNGIKNLMEKYNLTEEKE